MVTGKGGERDLKKGEMTKRGEKEVLEKEGGQ